MLDLVHFSHLVMSDTLRPHGLQRARPPCPSPTPEACSNSCPSSQWCHSTISSSVIPFSSRLQFFPASGSFPMSQLFASGGQNIGASASGLPMDILGLISYRIDWFDLLAVQRTLKSLLQKHNSKASVHWCSAFFMVQPFRFFSIRHTSVNDQGTSCVLIWGLQIIYNEQANEWT